MHLIQDDTRLHHSSFLACKLREPLKRFFQQIFQFYNMQKYIGNEILIIDSDRTRDTSLALNQAINSPTETPLALNWWIELVLL